MMKPSRNKGFTLLELMVVVGIIGILAAIAIPNFLEFKNRGYRASVQSDLKNAFKAGQIFFSINPAGVIVDASDLNVGGYVPTENVSIVIVYGTQASLTIKGYHVAAPDREYIIDEKGAINEL